MFGSSWFLRPGQVVTPWPSRFVGDEVDDLEQLRESAYVSGGSIGRGLSALGLGAWSLSHTGGGCHAYDCLLIDGSYLMVTASDVLSGFGDADDFHEGLVTVGLYQSEDSAYEGDGFLTIANAISPDGDRESAIVSAVGDVLATLGITSAGIDWDAVSAFVADALCAWCAGTGLSPYRDEPIPCSSCGWRGGE